MYEGERFALWLLLKNWIKNAHTLKDEDRIIGSIATLKGKHPFYRDAAAAQNLTDDAMTRTFMEYLSKIKANCERTRSALAMMLRTHYIGDANAIINDYFDDLTEDWSREVPTENDTTS